MGKVDDLRALGRGEIGRRYGGLSAPISAHPGASVAVCAGCAEKDRAIAALRAQVEALTTANAAPSSNVTDNKDVTLQPDVALHAGGCPVCEARKARGRERVAAHRTKRQKT